MSVGVVKFWSSRGWGMITPDGSHDSAFCHISDCRDENDQQLEIMREGDRVSLDVKQDRDGKGPRAWNVKLLAAAEGNK
jgi:cold shock protein